MVADGLEEAARAGALSEEEQRGLHNGFIQIMRPSLQRKRHLSISVTFSDFSFNFIKGLTGQAT